MISLSDFTHDRPWLEQDPALEDYTIADQIAGVRLQHLVARRDGRGDLTVLFSTHYGGTLPPPHVYWVTAAPGSVRAWVYHERQADRLAYTNGSIRVVLYDLRPESVTFQHMNIIDVGADNPTLLTIPPLVVHGVQNRGALPATFVNMPTNAYDPANPDKSRLQWDHPGIPYRFEP